MNYFRSYKKGAANTQSKRSTKLSHVRKCDIVFKPAVIKNGIPVAVPDIFLADGAASSAIDRGHSLSSLDSATGGGRLAPQTEPRPDIYKIVRKCLGQALYQTEICFNEIAAKAKHKIPPAHTINRGRGQEVLYTRNMKKAI